MPDQVGIPNYPEALDTALTLIQASNNSEDILAAPITDSAISLRLNSSLTFPASGLIVIDHEILTYTSKDNTFLLGLTRGVGNTTASAHSAQVPVRGLYAAQHHNVLSQVIIAIESKLGLGLSEPLPGSVLLGSQGGQSFWSQLAAPPIARGILRTNQDTQLDYTNELILVDTSIQNVEVKLPLLQGYTSAKFIIQKVDPSDNLAIVRSGFGEPISNRESFELISELHTLEFRNATTTWITT